MQWIKYSERLPEESYQECYLVAGYPTYGGCGKNYQIRMCCFDKENGFEFGEFDCGIDAKYWCKPELPKE